MPILHSPFPVFEGGLANCCCCSAAAGAAAAAAAVAWVSIALPCRLYTFTVGQLQRATKGSERPRPGSCLLNGGVRMSEKPNITLWTRNPFTEILGDRYNVMYALGGLGL